MTNQVELLIHSLSELLAVAEIAMPAAIFELDPRVHRAQQLVRHWSEGTCVPSIIPTSAASVAQWDITQGLDAFMAADQAPSTRTEAVVLILREWLTANGYLAMSPEDPN